MEQKPFGFQSDALREIGFSIHFGNFHCGATKGLFRATNELGVVGYPVPFVKLLRDGRSVAFEAL